MFKQMFDARWTLSVTKKWFKMIGHFLFPLSSKMLYINYIICWRYNIHVLGILCWHVFFFPKKTYFIYIKNTSLIQKHRSITLTWCCLCGKGMPFWRINGFEAVYATGALCGVTCLHHCLWHNRSHSSIFKWYMLA